MARGDIEILERKYHAKYGPLVRIAPNEVSCNEPGAIPIIYRERNPLPKAPWYKVFRPQGISNQADLFTETKEDKHARYRKIVGPAYQMGHILKNEASIDDCTNLFVKRLREFSARKQFMDFGHWLEMFAYDVIGRVQYGQMLGFLETGTDVGRWIESVTNALPLLHIAAAGPSYMVTPVMIMAMLLPGMVKNFKAVGEITEQAKQMTQARLKEDPNDNKVQQHDVMSQLFIIMRERGSQVGFTHREITLESWAGIIAGADSTATNMRAVFYYLMKHPSSLDKAVAEIQNADACGLLSSPVQYAETMAHLPYICACIKEATRLFPSFAIRLTRVAPTQGLQICGHCVPSGYWVGMNAAVVQHDKSVFGHDADAFRPERWLESQERCYAMEKGMLVFGAGTRTCAGKNVSRNLSFSCETCSADGKGLQIALAEVHKVVPEILRWFHLEMAHGREWKTWNAGFIKQSDVLVNLKARD
jgi:cytochrome P450